MKAFLVVLVLAFFIIAGSAYFFFTHHAPAPASFPLAVATTSVLEPPTVATSSVAVPAGMKLYKNPQYHFSLIYPDNLSVREEGGDGNPLTVAFEDEKSGQGFQVFALSYDEPTISPARFKLDEPSGVMQNKVDVIIDAVTGSHFNGSDALMGETAEVWMIHKGVLYEVSTYKELDSWLAGIMQTWKFI